MKLIKSACKTDWREESLLVLYLEGYTTRILKFIEYQYIIFKNNILQFQTIPFNRIFSEFCLKIFITESRPLFARWSGSPVVGYVFWPSYWPRFVADRRRNKTDQKLSRNRISNFRPPKPQTLNHYAIWKVI